jgi:dipeptidyl aminopeptidase/acylaminoacyl peptidase
MLFDRKAKTIREVLPRFDRWVDEFVWSPNSSKIYFASGSLGEEPVFSVNADGSSVVKLEDPYLRGEFGELCVSRDGAALVVTRMAADSPATIFSLGTKQEKDWTNDPISTISQAGLRRNHVELTAGWFPVKSHQLTKLNDELVQGLSLGSLDSFFSVGAGGTHVQGFIVKPPNFDPKKKYPVKFLIHGGPQGAWGDAWSYRWNPELMAASGYVVVMVNPRGSTGYGQAFIDGVNGDWGGKAYVDLMKGLDAAEQQFPFIDKDRECALGASYGGYMADWILTHTNRFKCIVTHDGMFNPAAAYGDTDELWFNEWEFRRPGDDKPGQPWRYASLPADQDPFRKWSPMLHIQDAKTPTLVIHSQRDYRLDVSEGYQLFTALQRLGVPSEMLYFPDEGHWVLKPRNSELWYKTVGDWCDKWTKAKD